MSEPDLHANLPSGARQAFGAIYLLGVLAWMIAVGGDSLKSGLMWFGFLLSFAPALLVPQRFVSIGIALISAYRLFLAIFMFTQGLTGERIVMPIGFLAGALILAACAVLSYRQLKQSKGS